MTFHRNVTTPISELAKNLKKNKKTNKTKTNKKTRTTQNRTKNEQRRSSLAGAKLLVINSVISGLGLEVLVTISVNTTIFLLCLSTALPFVTNLTQDNNPANRFSGELGRGTPTLSPRELALAGDKITVLTHRFFVFFLSVKFQKEADLLPVVRDERNFTTSPEAS